MAKFSNKFKIKIEFILVSTLRVIWDANRVQYECLPSVQILVVWQQIYHIFRMCVYDTSIYSKIFRGRKAKDHPTGGSSYIYVGTRLQ